ncbi:unnamed protein product [Arctia plantaginis]|uniref:Uncharacterized protein n=1 Tax=Arctia plantaginis TaxID=874455 RepID=A0A8S1BT04_ARCPL|nr:unnamed protein product [Arctia plantaginis]
MKAGQNHIYYIAGASQAEVRKSPFAERLVKRGYEVLYLTEAVYEYCLSSLPEYDGKKFQNIAKEIFDLEENEQEQETHGGFPKRRGPFPPADDVVSKKRGDFHHALPPPVSPRPLFAPPGPGPRRAPGPFGGPATWGASPLQPRDQKVSVPYPGPPTAFGWAAKMEASHSSNAHQKVILPYPGALPPPSAGPGTWTPRPSPKAHQKGSVRKTRGLPPPWWKGNMERPPNFPKRTRRGGTVPGALPRLWLDRQMERPPHFSKAHQKRGGTVPGTLPPPSAGPGTDASHSPKAHQKVSVP